MSVKGMRLAQFRRVRLCHAGLAAGIAILLTGATAHAQPWWERIVETGPGGGPVVVHRVDATAIARLSEAVGGVPMGIEEATPTGEWRREGVDLTGKTLAQALYQLTSLDSRYYWQDMGGVLVIRPREAWGNWVHRLHTPVGSVALEHIRGGDVLTIVARMLGARPNATGRLQDTARFTLNAPQGTILDFLNEAVRAHGQMSWALHYPHSGDDLTFSLFVGNSGSGLPVAADGVVIPVYLTLTPPVAADDPYLPVLQRVVPYMEDGSPHVLEGNVRRDVAVLARHTGVPMGVHVVPAPRRPSRRPVPVSGLRLRDALETFVRIDPQYQWQEEQGVVVVRPAGASEDPVNPLYRPVRNVQLEDVTIGRVLEYITSHLARRPFPRRAVGDSRRFSIDLAEGTFFDVLNETVRAHGHMLWQWSTLSEAQREEHATPDGPVSHTLSFQPFFAGSHVSLPIP